MMRSLGSWFYRHQGMKLPRYEDLVHFARRVDVISAGELWMFRCHQPSSSSETRLWMQGRPSSKSASTNRVPVSLRQTFRGKPMNWRLSIPRPHGSDISPFTFRTVAGATQRWGQRRRSSNRMLSFVHSIGQPSQNGNVRIAGDRRSRLLIEAQSRY